MHLMMINSVAIDFFFFLPTQSGFREGWMFSFDIFCIISERLSHIFEEKDYLWRILQI